MATNQDQPRTRAQSALTPTYSSLSALAAVAGGLNSGEPIEESIPRILDAVGGQLGAAECTLWLAVGNEFSARWTWGAPETTPDQIGRTLTGLSGPTDGLVVVPLDAAQMRIGALSLRRARLFLPEELLLLRTLANFLAPFLAAAEQSSRLAAEVELRTRQIEEQRRFTALIIDSLPVGLYVIDRSYRIQAWNKKRETGMQGVARHEAMGRTIFDILHRQKKEDLQREFDDVFFSGNVQQFLTESNAFGQMRIYRVSKIPMRLDGSSVTHVITIGEDVTEWKDAMDRMSQADKLAAVGQLAAGVMHEINNPLATIAACAESLTLLVEDMRAIGYAMNKQFAEYLGIIESEVQRCKRIVDGLLEFSHPRALTREVVSVNEIVDQSLFLVKYHAKFKRITIKRELDESVQLRTLANRDQLIQVFMALLVNAVDSMGEVGTVTVRSRLARNPSELAVVEVIDQGQGIARDDVHKIFEPFYTTKAPGRGTGLGLSICYAIVSAHGGRVEVESTLGKGSTFRVTLPSAGPA